MNREESSDSIMMADLFRRHRHDILNELQLVRAYTQMEQYDKAIAVTDRVALWLQSLSTWQRIFEDSGRDVVFWAGACPNVLLSDATATAVPSEDVATELIEWLQMFQQTLATAGRRCVLRMVVTGSKCNIHLSGESLGSLDDELERWRVYRTLVFVLD